MFTTGPRKADSNLLSKLSRGPECPRLFITRAAPLGWLVKDVWADFVRVWKQVRVNSRGALACSNLIYHEEHDGAQGLRRMSFDRVTQILSQYTESTRMFGKKSGVRIEVTHAEACVSQIRGSIKSSTDAQTTWNLCEIVSKVP